MTGRTLLLQAVKSPQSPPVQGPYLPRSTELPRLGGASAGHRTCALQLKDSASCSSYPQRGTALLQPQHSSVGSLIYTGFSCAPTRTKPPAHTAVGSPASHHPRVLIKKTLGDRKKQSKTSQKQASAGSLQVPLPTRALTRFLHQKCAPKARCCYLWLWIMRMS